MQIYSQLAPLALGGAHGSAVAMGFFDGIHIGHRAVINGAVEWARAHGAAPAVFTFRLPTENKMKGKRLLSTEDKHALIASLGVEHYLCPDFEEIKAMTPEQFVLGIIRDCNARALFCGENFTFGARAAGTPELLRQLCEPLGVEVVVLPMAQFEEKPVSSTRIRTALEGGDIPAANAMLGMPYAIRFTVHHGAGLGRTLGVPTINSPLKNLVLDVDHNGFLLVIHTSPGAAQLIARMLDSLGKAEGILGTIAGDDTIFITPTSDTDIEELYLSALELFEQTP